MALRGIRIIKEIKSKNTQYQEEVIGGNSQSFFLIQIFKVDFKAFMRRGYYVDALLDIDQTNDSEGIISRLQKANIQTHKISLFGKNHLVIPEVNTKEVADKIYTLYFAQSRGILSL